MADVRIEYGKDWSGLTGTLAPYSQVLVVADRNVAVYASTIAAGRPIMYIDATEQDKNIETVMEICRWLLSMNADRGALLLAIGGGITTDMAGFAASIYKRGIRYANIPTTLLAQADAAIGGKTGVNVDGLKNMIGTFCQPQFTYISPLPLASLSDSEMASGLAEILKTFIIADATLYEYTVKAVREGRFQAEAASLAMEAARIKAGIVKRDERESGLRQVLNLGHTFGHAIEWYQQTHKTEQVYSHGQAVAIGIVIAAGKSETDGLACKGLKDKIMNDFKDCNLPVTPPCSLSELMPAIAKDKKASGGNVRFILIEDIGKVTIK